ncbi:hypothetical protein [Parabacteroides distasonis]|uniref:hypothetical protein n=1 Tax=Parabacteroides distasonis TaxID=823 RepID=UPI00125DD1D5|nr:hypothetical protein [Parabacteroides distasonis]KAB5466253.1 hypothetical protein F9Z97_08090 [Parabacteroides distasonis]MDB9064384.1 hypothetical protein [Parabacteroides distasonis]
MQAGAKRDVFPFAHAAVGPERKDTDKRRYVPEQRQAGCLIKRNTVLFRLTGRSSGMERREADCRCSGTAFRTLDWRADLRYRHPTLIYGREKPDVKGGKHRL